MTSKPLTWTALLVGEGTFGFHDLLESAGFVVHHALDGAYALQLVQRGSLNIDVVAVDPQLPNVSAGEMIADLKQVPGCWGAAFVTTASGDHGSIVELPTFDDESEPRAQRLLLIALTTILGKLAAPTTVETDVESGTEH